MQIHIIEIDKGEKYMVNDQVVYKDGNNNWISPTVLTPLERNMLMAFLRLRKISF